MMEAVAKEGFPMMNTGREIILSKENINLGMAAAFT
jgi:hypothetical protein